MPSVSAWFRIRFVIVLLLGAALGCGPAPGGGDSGVRTQPQPDAEVDAVAALDGPGARPDTAPDAQQPLWYASAVIRNGGFEMFFPDGYHRFSYQPVMFFVDTNDDGICDVAAGDIAATLRSNAHNSNGPIEVSLDVAFNWEADGGALWFKSDPKVCDAMNVCR
jgi:ABC-type transport system substrate-binding protein